MKANQKFMDTDDAVSPVIGVILMVAITVVLAAVVFVLVSNLSDTKDQAPDIGLTRQESDDRISIVSTDSGLNWGQFRIVADNDLFFDINSPASLADEEFVRADGAEAIDGTVTPASVAAADYISICGGNGAGGAAADVLNNVNVRIIHEETNTQIFETTFSTVAVCPATG